jgi:hypothetical protein
LPRCSSWSTGIKREGKGFSKEDPHASNSNPRCPPPRPRPLTIPSNPNQLWLALPADQRLQLLLALSRVVAVHLASSPVPQEVTYEQA